MVERNELPIFVAFRRWPSLSTSSVERRDNLNWLRKARPGSLPADPDIPQPARTTQPACNRGVTEKGRLRPLASADENSIVALQ